MPRMPRRSMSARVTIDSVWLRLKLLDGHSYPFLLDGQDEPPEDEIREAWEQLRDWIVHVHVFGLVAEGDDPTLYLSNDFLRKHPGSRPWAWWKYDASEPRRQIGDGPEAIGPPDWFGLPRGYRGFHNPKAFETEADYLERLDLFLPGEAELLDA
jgi:hypothetical protein